MYNSCRFENEDYVLIRTELVEAIFLLPENYGMSLNFGRGTDAYQPIGIHLVVEGGRLILDELRITHQQHSDQIL